MGEVLSVSAGVEWTRAVLRQWVYGHAAISA
jgi:hypothetical protein